MYLYIPRFDLAFNCEHPPTDSDLLSIAMDELQVFFLHPNGEFMKVQPVFKDGRWKAQDKPIRNGRRVLNIDGKRVSYDNEIADSLVRAGLAREVGETVSDS